MRNRRRETEKVGGRGREDRRESERREGFDFNGFGVCAGVWEGSDSRVQRAGE